ncbi:hypothetical protein [Streptomyces sp. PA5.6]|uniref:hypothetical protein n=1 Tax=Streptomyces sp. PA5.6 TaxID=3035651 RepID=UPI003904BE88
MRVLRRAAGLALATATVAAVVAAGFLAAAPAATAASHKETRQARSGPAELADTGSSRTLLLSGAAAALCGLGVLVIVAARRRRD